MTDFVRFNSLGDVPWYHTLFDVMVLAMLAFAVTGAVKGWRRGRRDYAVLLLVAPLYGMFLEISGMLTHKSYLQGEFLVMFDFTQWDAFKGSTDIPLYVPLFYPSFLSLGYRLTESFGIASLPRRALAGACMMGLLDVAYIIQGGLLHVVWWTWRDYEMYQLWQGWPGIDLWWEMVGGGALFFMLWRLTPRIDAWYRERPDDRRRNDLKTLVGAPLGLAVAINVVLPVLMLPPAILARAGHDYWPFIAVCVAVAAVFFLRTPKAPRSTIDSTVLGIATVYLAGFAPMLVGNLVHEGGITLYIATQAAALAGLVAVVTYPRWARSSARGSAPAEQNPQARAERSPPRRAPEIAAPLSQVGGPFYRSFLRVPMVGIHALQEEHDERIRGTATGPLLRSDLRGPGPGDRQGAPAVASGRDRSGRSRASRREAGR